MTKVVLEVFISQETMKTYPLSRSNLQQGSHPQQPTLLWSLTFSVLHCRLRGGTFFPHGLLIHPPPVTGWVSVGVERCLPPVPVFLEYILGP